MSCFSKIGSVEVLLPVWTSPANVQAFTSLRTGGFSLGPWGSVEGTNGFNPASHVGDSEECVSKNRLLLREILPTPPNWVSQVHGTKVLRAESVRPGDEADAVITSQPGAVCVIQTADCLPVLLSDVHGKVVGVAHAGWRGLLSGVLQETVSAMKLESGLPDLHLCAWIGPCIRRKAFEVGEEVVEMFRKSVLKESVDGAVSEQNGKIHLDLPRLATEALRLSGVSDVSDSGLCTFSDPEHFYSYRRDHVCGRHATLIYLEGTYDWKS